MIAFLAVGIEGLGGSNVLSFAIGFGMERLRFFYFCEASFDGGLVRIVPKLMPQADSHSPMGHRTLRIVFRDLLKLLRRLFIPERMQQRDTAFKPLLHRRCARNWKMHRPQLFRCHFFVMMTLVSQRRKAQGQQHSDQAGKRFHGSHRRASLVESEERVNARKNYEVRVTDYDLKTYNFHLGFYPAGSSIRKSSIENRKCLLQPESLVH